MTRRIMLGVLMGTPLVGLIQTAIGSPTLTRKPGDKIIHGFGVNLSCRGFSRVVLAVEQNGLWAKISEEIIEPGRENYQRSFSQPIYGTRWIVSVSALDDKKPVELFHGAVDLTEGKGWRRKEALGVMSGPQAIFNRRALPRGERNHGIISGDNWRGNRPLS